MNLGQDDKDDDLKIELHTDAGEVASAVVKVADVWAVSADCIQQLMDSVMVIILSALKGLRKEVYEDGTSLCTVTHTMMLPSGA